MTNYRTSKQGRLLTSLQVETFAVRLLRCLFVASRSQRVSLIVISFCLSVWMSVSHSATYSLPRLIDHNQIWSAGIYLSLDLCKPFWIPYLPYFRCQREKYAKFHLSRVFLPLRMWRIVPHDLFIFSVTQQWILNASLCFLVCLTESLLSLKKRRLLASLDASLLTSVPYSSAASGSSHSNSVTNQETFDLDAEFAAFQVLAYIFLYEIYAYKDCLIKDLLYRTYNFSIFIDIHT